MTNLTKPALLCVSNFPKRQVAPGELTQIFTVELEIFDQQPTYSAHIEDMSGNVISASKEVMNNQVLRIDLGLVGTQPDGTLKFDISSNNNLIQMQIINHEERAVKGVVMDLPGQRINMDDILPDGMKANQAYVIRIPAPQYA